MLHARPDYNRIQDPEKLIGEDEPVFLLRAQDRLAPATLRYWASMTYKEGGTFGLMKRVLDHASLMETWQAKNGSKVADITPEQLEEDTSLSSKSNLRAHADRELRNVGYNPDSSDFIESRVYKDVMSLIDALARLKLSGGIAPTVLRIFEKLAKYDLLSPLTGEDDEWLPIEEGTLSYGPTIGKVGMLYQNKRASHVFKHCDYAYDLNGIIFTEPSGTCYTSNESQIPVTFPYTPAPKYINVDNDGTPIPHAEDRKTFYIETGNVITDEGLEELKKRFNSTPE